MGYSLIVTKTNPLNFETNNILIRYNYIYICVQYIDF